VKVEQSSSLLQLSLTVPFIKADKQGDGWGWSLPFKKRSFPLLSEAGWGYAKHREKQQPPLSRSVALLKRASPLEGVASEPVSLLTVPLVPAVFLLLPPHLFQGSCEAGGDGKGKGRSRKRRRQGPGRRNQTVETGTSFSFGKEIRGKKKDKKVKKKNYIKWHAQNLNVKNHT